jgi:hypothetical protein
MLGFAALHHPLRGALHLPHRPALRHGLLGDFALQVDGRQPQQTPCVPGGKAAFGNQLLEVSRKLE